MSCEIQLRNGLIALVDADDHARLSQYAWIASGDETRGFYAIRHSGGKAVWMHREVIDAPAGLEVDHINRNPLDNRRANLRLATRQENARNRIVRRSRPGFKGVYPRGDRWRALIMVDGQQVSLGGFATEIEAAVAYDVAAKEMFGEFARLNFDPARDWMLPYGAAR